MKWIILLSLGATDLFGAIWVPHQKEMWGLIRRAERTPEMQTVFRYPGIETLSRDHQYEIASEKCYDEIELYRFSKILSYNKEECQKVRH